jgi:hypothetical protein
MAETRAVSRALRGVLETVFALGGYEGTAAEEIVSDSASSKPEPEKPADARSPLPPEVQPTNEQLDRIATLIRSLTELDPRTDWAARCRQIVGVPGDKLTRTYAEILVCKLEEQLAELVSAEGAA